MSSETESDAEVAWLRAQRAAVERYLTAEGVSHGGVDAEPAWYAPDVLAIWPVRSAARPGTLGWWAVSGDVPTDYVTADAGMDARGALTAIAVRWRAAAARMAGGLAPEDVAIGAPEEWPTLAPMLRSRSDVLAAWAGDAELWS